MCQCVTANPDICLSKRYGVSLDFVSLVGGCNCKCHFTDNGALLPAKLWLHRKQQQINRRVVILVQEEK